MKIFTRIYPFSGVLSTLIMLPFFGHAQAGQYEVLPDSGAVVYITGGSTLHDWKVSSPDVYDYPRVIEITGSGPFHISDFHFKVAVATMEGGRGATMDKKIKEALKADVFPFIAYSQKEDSVFDPAGTDSGIKLISKGMVSIAGVDRLIEVEVKGVVRNNLLIFEGQKDLLLSDFDIAPPSAMFGQIKTKNEITVHFGFRYKKK